MARVLSIQQLGNQYKVNFNDGTNVVCYPTMGGLFVARNQTGVYDPDPDPNTDPPDNPPDGSPDSLYNPWADTNSQGSWEDHRTYSQGGKDYSLGYGTQLVAPAAGILRAGTWTDAAGRRQVLDLYNAYYRVKPASLTLMNGATREAEGPMTAIVFQHLSTFGVEGVKARTDNLGKSGASASPSQGDYGGDIHLHIHGLDRAGSRLDFWKFF